VKTLRTGAGSATRGGGGGGVSTGLGDGSGASFGAGLGVGGVGVRGIGEFPEELFPWPTNRIVAAGGFCKSCSMFTSSQFK